MIGRADVSVKEPISFRPRQKINASQITAVSVEMTRERLTLEALIERGTFDPDNFRHSMALDESGPLERPELERARIRAQPARRRRGSGPSHASMRRRTPPANPWAGTAKSPPRRSIRLRLDNVRADVAVVVRVHRYSRKR
jgi:hypothetical protein